MALTLPDEEIEIETATLTVHHDLAVGAVVVDLLDVSEVDVAEEMRWFLSLRRRGSRS